MSTVETPGVAPDAAPLSQGARVVNTFFAPSKTFNDLRRSASWWLPWLLIAIVSVIFINSVGRYVGFDQVAKNALAQSPKQSDQFEKLPADQQAKQMQVRTAATRYISYAVPAIIVIVWLLIAGVLMGVFNLGLGTSVPYKIVLAIVAYSGLPGIIGSILATVSVIVGGTSGSLDREAFNIQNPVATNLAYFMDPMGNKFLYGMASAVNIFMIWSLVLMGIGFACNSKVKRGTAIWTVVIVYLVYRLIASGLGAVMS